MSKLEKRLKKLEEKVAGLEVVGEIYSGSYSFYGGHNGVFQIWSKFREKDVTDRVDGYIKIHQGWHPTDEVVFYRDENRIQNLKKKIEKKKEEKKCPIPNLI